MSTDKPRPYWMVCAVCGYPLEHAVDPAAFGGQEWIHIRQSDDHMPVPVDATEILINQRCDFCDRENATDIILATSFDLPMGGSRSIGHWAACEQCAEEVRRKRWGQLVTRVKQGPGMATRRYATRKDLLALYAELDKHIIGQMGLAEWKANAAYPLPTEE